MSLYVRSVETALPEKKISVEELSYLSKEQQAILRSMGFGSYYQASPQKDNLDLIVESARKVLKSTNAQADFYMAQPFGNHRTYGDHSLVPFLQREIGLTACPGMLLSSACTSIPTALTLIEGLAASRPQYKNVLLSLGSGIFPPYSDQVVNADVEKHRGLVYGSGGVSLMISTEPGPIQILETSLGTSYIEGESWDIPSGIVPFEYNDKSEIIGGGTGYISWRNPTPNSAPSGEYVSPAQIVMKETIRMIAGALQKHSVSKVQLSCIPVGKVQVDQVLQQALGSKTQVLLNNSVYAEYGHVGGCDPGFVMKQALEKKQSGVYCHLCIGQGYTGSFVLFKVL